MSKKMILDVGCGEHSRGTHNIDIYKPTLIPKNFVLASGEYLPFKNTTFNKVFLIEVLDHLENPGKCIRDIHRVLIEKETLILISLNPIHIRSFLRGLRGKPLEFGENIHFYAWTNAEINCLLKKIGFRNIQIQYIMYSPYRFKLLDKIFYKVIPKNVSGRNLKVVCQKNELKVS